MTIVKAKTKLRKSPAEKKRYGEHHQTRSRHYIKTYWPYLPMLMLVAVSLLVSSLFSSHPSVLGQSSNLSSSSFLKATNNDRLADMESALTLNSELTEAAQNKAEAMVSLNFWSHTAPSGETPWQYISASGYNYQEAGENLAYGFSNASQVVSAWMSSPEHRANILNASYQDVGFGVASSKNFVRQGPETVVVAEYAEPVSGVKGASTVITNADNSSSQVSRIQEITDTQAWSLVAAAFLTGFLICYLVFRNVRKLKKVWKRGEKLARTHILLDLLIVLLICVGYILTRSSGVIH